MGVADERTVITLTSLQRGQAAIEKLRIPTAVLGRLVAETIAQESEWRDAQGDKELHLECSAALGQLETILSEQEGVRDADRLIHMVATLESAASALTHFAVELEKMLKRRR
jgi:hypothetical protein